jgi:hypothetical protein
METLIVRGRNFVIAGLFLSLMVCCWAPAGWSDETKSEQLQKVEAAAKAAAAEPEKPEWSFSTDFLNQYVWRGIALSRNAFVIQPSFTGSYKGFSFNAWTNLDMNERNPYGNNTHRGAVWNETDLTFSYSREVIKNFSLTGGLIYYILDGNNSQFNSVELYADANYTLPWFDFGVSAFREVAHFPGTYLQWYIHKAVNLPWYGMNLDLFASWSAEFSNDKAAYPVFDSAGNQVNEFYQSLHAGFLSAALNIPLGKYVVVAPKIQYWYGLGGQSTGTLRALSWDQQQNHVLGGLNVTINF